MNDFIGGAFALMFLLGILAYLAPLIADLIGAIM
jgi:hypothetical protein